MNIKNSKYNAKSLSDFIKEEKQRIGVKNYNKIKIFNSFIKVCLLCYIAFFFVILYRLISLSEPTPAEMAIPAIALVTCVSLIVYFGRRHEDGLYYIVRHWAKRKKLELSPILDRRFKKDCKLFEQLLKIQQFNDNYPYSKLIKFDKDGTLTVDYLDNNNKKHTKLTLNKTLVTKAVTLEQIDCSVMDEMLSLYMASDIKE